MQHKQFPVQAWYASGSRYGAIESPAQITTEAALSQITQAEEWLKSRGANRVYAPMGRSTWYPYRATFSKSREPFFYGETNFDPNVWIAAGYTIAARYISSSAENRAQIQSALHRKIRLEKLGWRAEIYDSNQKNILKSCHQIANKAFSSAFCFQPIMWEEFRAMYQPLLLKIDPRLVLIARSPEGNIRGFCLSYPDINNPSLQRFVLKTLAVDPEFAGQGIGSWLTGEAHAQAEKIGLVGGGIHAYMWSGSHSQSISSHAGSVIREYALFEKDLSYKNDAVRTNS